MGPSLPVCLPACSWSTEVPDMENVKALLNTSVADAKSTMGATCRATRNRR